jgi:adenosylcobinamide-phosphate synthase
VWNVIFYSLPEILIMLIAAIMIDWMVGDPRRLPHPVIGIGRLISALERRLHKSFKLDNRMKQRSRGVLLTIIVTLASGIIVWGICALLGLIHPWLGLAAHTWLISTTIAVKGLKEAAMLVYEPLIKGDLDTADLNESEVSRAAVETVAENTVDALVSPIIYALLGGAPLAMLYRATNTLDSMVGYKNDKYLHFGWASARWDDVMNYVPARLCGLLLVLSSWLRMRMSGVNAWRAIWQFARLHPSPNSGIPESAVAGALGIELGGTNRYGDRISERARMGWPRRALTREDIRGAVKLLYGVSYALVGGCLCGLLITLL